MNFKDALRQKLFEEVRAGRVPRRRALVISLALIVPFYARQAESLFVMQRMSDGVGPREASRDWGAFFEGLANFAEVFLPLLIELLIQLGVGGV